MTALLSKAEGQYLIIYFFCVATGLRVSEPLPVEIDKHIQSDCTVIGVRQQGRSTQAALTRTSRPNRDAATWIFTRRRRQFCATSSAIGRAVFFLRLRTAPCSLRAALLETVSIPSYKK